MIDYLKKWQRFSTGFWQKALPKKPGTYPTADREGNRGPDRTLVRTKRDKIFDPASPFKNYEDGGTDWAGWWWSEPYPDLPEPEGWDE